MRSNNLPALLLECLHETLFFLLWTSQLILEQLYQMLPILPLVLSRGPGRFGVYAERAPETVTVDGARVEASFADGLVTLDLAAAGEREVVLSWE